MAAGEKAPAKPAPGQDPPKLHRGRDRASLRDAQGHRQAMDQAGPADYRRPSAGADPRSGAAVIPREASPSKQTPVCPRAALLPEMPTASSARRRARGLPHQRSITGQSGRHMLRVRFKDVSPGQLAETQRCRRPFAGHATGGFVTYRRDIFPLPKP